MAKWLHSGRRRDVCVLLYEAGELRAQRLKNRLSTHYDERIDPGSFSAMLAALEDAGHVEAHTEGIADVYGLTDAGERALLDHYGWLAGNIENANDECDEGTDDANGERVDTEEDGAVDQESI
ncbi:PadR family transcriptional regulator [Halopenitus salinus]|uniref:PadR family transcriptional regulator n=1 Tax=Halopenitus salinus TaxID=1198295 RepID=A0ABD5UUI4_9EURY